MEWKISPLRNSWTNQICYTKKIGKVDRFGWWDIEIIQTDAGAQFASKEFQEGLCVYGVQLAIMAPDHQ